MNHALPRQFSPNEAAAETRCEPGIPSWAPAALEALYGNLYACLTQFEIGFGLSGLHTYSVRTGGQLCTLLMFRLRGHRAEVCNEVIAIGTDEVAAFDAYVFAHFPQVRVVAWRAVHTPPQRQAAASQYYDYLEDTIITLPASAEAYFASLSKNTRRNLQRQERWGRTELAGFRICVRRCADIDPEQAKAVIALNHARMEFKHKQSGIDAEETARILRLVRERGMMVWIEVDGKVAAGALGATVGRNFFLMVLAHDPAYNAYGLGILCCYRAICESIADGCAEFHFLWGLYDYKRSFLGAPRALYRLLVYRSRMAQLAEAPLAFAAWRHSARRRLLAWLKEQDRKDAAMARALRTARERLLRLRGARQPT
ncbi:MAG TPA: GNAT family N-acetyltransferase [Telluria sp.]|nr:GNAT family N-acetyltransferase [Telluria sp.]